MNETKNNSEFIIGTEKAGKLRIYKSNNREGFRAMVVNIFTDDNGAKFVDAVIIGGGSIAVDFTNKVRRNDDGIEVWYGYKGDNQPIFFSADNFCDK